MKTSNEKSIFAFFGWFCTHFVIYFGHILAVDAPKPLSLINN
jgi:hypothetical protein